MPKAEKKSDENLTKICTICFLEKTVSPANSHFSCVKHCISFQSKFSIFVTDFFEKKKNTVVLRLLVRLLVCVFDFQHVFVPFFGTEATMIPDRIRPIIDV